MILVAEKKDDVAKSMENLGIGNPSSSFKRKPVIIIVVGMAGITTYSCTCVILALLDD